MPEMMETVADALSLDAAEKLADTLGGLEVTIPREAGNGCSLGVAVGHDIAAVLIEHYGGGQCSIPKWESRRADKNRLIVANNNKLSTNELVSLTGLSCRQIRRIRASLSPPPRRNKRQHLDRVQT